MTLPAQLPIGVDIVRKAVATGREHYYMSDEFADYLLEFAQQMSAAPQTITRAAVTLTAQGASIAPVPFAFGSVSNTRFRVSYVAQVEQPATTNSSLIVKVSYLKNGFTVVEERPAMTSNDPTFPQSGEFIVEADTPTVSYVVAWASVGATSMTYRIRFSVEALP